MARSTHHSRRDLIVQLVRETGFVRNSELSDRFGVSTVTIRQDIDALSAKGLVQRTYGGAIFQGETGLDTAFDLRSAEHVEAKRRIGAAAAKSILPGETILLDSGSTTIEVARQLPENADITVVTPALNIALEAGAKAGVSVIVCGGRLNPRTLSTAGQETARHLSAIFADRLFLATYGVDLDKGLAERSFEVAETKRALIGAAREITLVCEFEQVRLRRAGADLALARGEADHHRRRHPAGVPRVAARKRRRCGVGMSWLLPPSRGYVLAENPQPRHGRACPGHPRLSSVVTSPLGFLSGGTIENSRKGVDGRDKPGHDGEGSGRRIVAETDETLRSLCV